MRPPVQIMNVLAQSPQQEASMLAGLLALLIVVAFVAYVVFVARWMHRDATRRGHSATLWTTLFVLLSLPFIGGVIGGVVVLIIYLASRSSQLKYDDHGNPIGGVPAMPASSPQWQPAPAAASPGSTQSPPVQPVAYNPPAPPPPVQTPQPAATATAPLPRVKCPKCGNIFPFQRSLEGRTHVKCPNCGEEGDI